MSAHPTLWTSPTPLWGRFGDVLGGAAFGEDDQARPAILRFATDDFMEQLLGMLATNPRQLGETIARPETWRTPAEAPRDAVQRVQVPRIARQLARVRKSEALSTLLKRTVKDEQFEENGVSRTAPLKLYHPAHQRHYLVAANLVCGLPGFPDRSVATGGREQVGFVLRRLLPPKNAASGADLEEFGFVKDDAGARWQRVTPDPAADDRFAALAPGEELLALFPLGFQDDADRPRRLWAGSVPVGRREEYMTSAARYEPPVAAPSGATGAAGASVTDATVVSARKEQFKLDVSEPWKNLIRTAYKAATSVNDTTGDPPSLVDQRRAALRANQQLQGQSWLLLLDFADYLATHLPRVWAWVADAGQKPSLDPPEQGLLDWLGDVSKTGFRSDLQLPEADFASNLREALKGIRMNAVRKSLESAVRSYPDQPGDPVDGLAWPAFLYLFAGVREQGPASFVADGIHASLGGFAALPNGSEETDAQLVPQPPPAEQKAALVDRVVQLVVAALDKRASPAPSPPVPFALQLREALKTTIGDEGRFVLRCAYVRCDCGPLRPVVLSAPSQQFQLAGFFDPDAPARPLRIALPVDTTPAGLRKFNKNTAFILSDVLCGQVQRAKGLGFIDLVLAVLPWPLHKDLDVGGLGPCQRSDTFGMICSISIPIITICALILLIIIVTLLDLIFKWLPWFILCFPVPGLKAKR